MVINEKTLNCLVEHYNNTESRKTIKVMEQNYIFLFSKLDVIRLLINILNDLIIY